jgi:hypothetical protein
VARRGHGTLETDDGGRSRRTSRGGKSRGEAIATRRREPAAAAPE